MKKIILIIVVLILIGAAAAIYLWNKPHRDVQSEEASIELNATELHKAFVNDLASSNATYLEQAVAVKGIISEIDENHIMLDPGIYCEMLEGFDGSQWEVGTKVVVKGRVISYDELFGDVRMDNCAIVQ